MAYRPPQWNQNDPSESARTSITDASGNIYIFDAIMRLEHSSQNRITEHPVQTGANISDHSFSLPDHVVMEIGMSDCMDVFTPGQFDDNDSPSISAYQTLKQMKTDRLPLTLTTRLDTYENMVIEQIHAPDDVKTMYALRCTVAFRQIMTATVNEITVSSRPQTTGDTKKGTVQGRPPTDQEASVLSTIIP